MCFANFCQGHKESNKSKRVTLTPFLCKREEYDYVTSVQPDESNSDGFDSDSDVETCSCIEFQTENSTIDETRSLDGDDLYSVYVDVEKANPICIKLNDLIKREKVQNTVQVLK